MNWWLLTPSVGGGEEDGDGIPAQEEKGSSAGADGELDWVSEFMQKKTEREMVNKLKVGNWNIKYFGTEAF